MKNITIRAEKNTDKEAIWEVNREAFGGEDEANLVDTLRDSGCVYISLVAELDNQIVGHILYTPVTLSENKSSLKLIGLAPMSVLSQYQKQGIGSQLVKAGLERCKDLNYDAVVVLGHPTYYPKFGFIPAKKYGIQSEYEVPDEAFMILELVPGSLEGQHGTISYHEAFNNV